MLLAARSGKSIEDNRSSSAAPSATFINGSVSTYWCCLDLFGSGLISKDFLWWGCHWRQTLGDHLHSYIFATVLHYCGTMHARSAGLALVQVGICSLGTGADFWRRVRWWSRCQWVKRHYKALQALQALHQAFVWHVAEVCLDAFCFPVQGLRLLSRRAHDCQGPCWTVGVFFWARDR